MRRHLISGILCVALFCRVWIPGAGAQKRVALLIAGGICDSRSAFARYGPNLQAPPNDVRLMADLLIGRYGFKNSNISIVGIAHTQRERIGRGCRFLGDRATRNAILSATTAILSTARSDDYVLIYYSGHGAPVFDLDEGIDVGALVTFEGTTEAAVRRKDLEDKLDKCPSRHITLILDACFSGLFAKPGLHSAAGIAELRDLPGLSVQNISKSLPIRQSPGAQAGNRPIGKLSPIRDSAHRFTTLTACDDDEQTQEARFVGTGDSLAISEFTWAIYRTLWQNQQMQTLEDLHVALSKRLTIQKQRQIPQFCRGVQRSEIIGPALWSTLIPRLPLIGGNTPILALGRLGGISRNMRFCEEGDRKGVPDPQGATLRVNHLNWFETTLSPDHGHPRHRAFVLPTPGTD